MHKDPGEAKIRFAFAFPDVYEVGMSHLGLQIIYSELNKRPDVWAERAFAPWVDMEECMRERGVPLFALESRQPVKELDILGFTLQHELSYTNVVNMLDLAGIPLWSSDRDERDPLVIGGGPCAFNPEPVSGFFDALVLGEAEGAVHEVVDCYAAWRNSPGRTRRGLLDSLSRIEGVYVPSLYQRGPAGEVVPASEGVPKRVRRRILRDLDSVSPPGRPVVPFIETVHDRIVIEVFRGCSRGCRFCLAGTIYRPVRERSPDAVLEAAERGIRETGHREVSLASLSTADYTGIEDLLKRLHERFRGEAVGVSLPSLRVDAFSVGLANQAQRVRKAGLTFAPEAGSQRLRDVINKGITEDEILRAVEAAATAGWNSIKLYFMIGLPTETDEDVEAIDVLVGKIKAAWSRTSKTSRKPRLAVSVSVFVPKPHTPFQWEPYVSPVELKRRQDILTRLLGRRKEVKLNWHDPGSSLVEAALARGDRSLGGVVLEAWRRGCKFDAWTDQFDFDAWMGAFSSLGMDPEELAGRSYRYEDPLPWDHLDTGVKKEYLAGEHAKALRGETTRDCRLDGCAGCGVCGEGIRVKLAGRSGSPGG